MYTESILLGFYLFSTISGLILHFIDQKLNSPGTPLMNLVWTLTITYSGLLGLFVYWYSGRKQIPSDSFYRRSFRSTLN